jgi:hypothetical protein
MPVKPHALIPVGLALAMPRGSLVANRQGRAASVPGKGLPDSRPLRASFHNPDRFGWLEFAE